MEELRQLGGYCSKGSQSEHTGYTAWEATRESSDTDRLKFNREKPFGSNLLGFKQLKSTFSQLL